jgi:hypothetical protein
MHSRGPALFFFWGSVGEVLDFFCSQCVPIQLFSKCSSNSQCVPQHVPNSTLLHLMSFALSFILVTFTSSPKGGHYDISILGPYKALLNFFVMDK